MYFYMPAKIYEEQHCVINHKKELAALGSHALIVTGKHSAKKNGSLDDVQEALRAEGISWTVFDRVEENPSVETVMDARDMGIGAQADFVIGIGGGSAMDAAKAIALMIRHREAGAAYLYEKGADTTVPIALVPTTCGTGSEATAVSVLTRHDTATKGSIPHKIFADLSLVDAGYLKAAPLSVLCNTAVDAFAHMAESIANMNATDYSRMCAFAGMDLWRGCREVLLGLRPAAAEDYKKLMNASTMAGMAICHTGTSLPHGLSYALTYELGMPHGKAAGYFLAGYLRECEEELRQSVLSAAGFADTEELEAFYERVCGRSEVPEELLERTVSELLQNEAKLKNCPYKADEQTLRRIAGLC